LVIASVALFEAEWTTEFGAGFMLEDRTEVDCAAAWAVKGIDGLARRDNRSRLSSPGEASLPIARAMQRTKGHDMSAITGIAGQVGGVVATALLNGGKQVRALTRGGSRSRARLVTARPPSAPCCANSWPVSKPGISERGLEWAHFHDRINGRPWPSRRSARERRAGGRAGRFSRHERATRMTAHPLRKA
jgi:hypothetical protein